MVKWRSLLLGGAISAVCIVLLLRSVDLSKTGQTFAQADPFWIAVALATIGGSLWMRVWKWQLLFLPDDRVGFRNAGAACLVGYMFNTVLPGRVGELARVALIGQSEGVSAGRGLGTIVIEKILDVLMLLVILGALTLFVPLPGWVVTAGVTASVTFGAVAVVFFALSGARSTVVAWVARRVDSLPVFNRVQPSRLADTLLGASRSLSRPPLLGLQILGTVVLWLFAAGTALATLRAFHVDVPLAAALLLLVTTNLGMTVPSAPGYIGVYHAIAVLTLGLFGVDPAPALSVAIVLHALGFGTFTLFGAVVFVTGLLRGRYSLGGLFRFGAAPAPANTGVASASA
jgi:uncharacterized protein (TIRG00374 family)